MAGNFAPRRPFPWVFHCKLGVSIMILFVVSGPYQATGAFTVDHLGYWKLITTWISDLKISSQAARA
jgi:hypothetical protein